jgi:hypothetical protein
VKLHFKKAKEKAVARDSLQLRATAVCVRGVAPHDVRSCVPASPLGHTGLLADYPQSDAQDLEIAHLIANLGPGFFALHSPLVRGVPAVVLDVRSHSPPSASC